MVWLRGKRKIWGVILRQPEGAKERAVGTQAAVKDLRRGGSLEEGCR